MLTLRAAGEASRRTLMLKTWAVGENETPLTNRAECVRPYELSARGIALNAWACSEFAAIASAETVVRVCLTVEPLQQRCKESEESLLLGEWLSLLPAMLMGICLPISFSILFGVG